MGVDDSVNFCPCKRGGGGRLPTLFWVLPVRFPQIMLLAPCPFCVPNFSYFLLLCRSVERKGARERGGGIGTSHKSMKCTR